MYTSQEIFGLLGTIQKNGFVELPIRRGDNPQDIHARVQYVRKLSGVNISGQDLTKTSGHPVFQIAIIKDTQ